MTMSTGIPSFLNEIIIIQDIQNGGFVGLIPGMDGAVIIGDSVEEIMAKAPKIASRLSSFKSNRIAKEFSNIDNFKVSKQLLAPC